MKLSRQSNGCQRNRAISRMRRCLDVVQAANRSKPISDLEMTPSHQDASPADSPQTLFSWAWRAAAVGSVALLAFAPGLFAPSFVDEYAYTTQSFYADLFVEGKF